MTQEFYDRAVAIAEFEGHCAQRRKYPVLLKLEFNSAIRDKEMVHSVRNGTVRCNQEKNQNPRILPCECCSLREKLINLPNHQVDYFWRYWVRNYYFPWVA